MTARKDDKSPIKSIFCHKRPYIAIKDHKRPYKPIQDQNSSNKVIQSCIQPLFHWRTFFVLFVTFFAHVSTPTTRTTTRTTKLLVGPLSGARGQKVYSNDNFKTNKR